MKDGKTKCEENVKKGGASEKIENKVKSEKTNGEKDDSKPIVEDRPGVSNKILDDEIKPLDLSSLKSKKLEENEHKCENGLKTKAEERFSIKNIIFDEKTKPGVQTSIKVENLVHNQKKSEPNDTVTCVEASNVLEYEKEVKTKIKRDRFNGISEEEIAKKGLPDYLRHGLDIVFIGINPGMFAAYTGKYYAGPGNHFWKALYLSGLIPEPMSPEDDSKLLDMGIGFTNIVSRTTRGIADLTKQEIADGAKVNTNSILDNGYSTMLQGHVYKIFHDFSFGL